MRSLPPGLGVVRLFGLFLALFILAFGAASLAETRGPETPAPGTYHLDHIQRVPLSLVREDSGFPRLLSTYTTGAVTLLTFFYSQCADPQGCPLAWSTFESVHEEIRADKDLQGRVRLVFYSFDPDHDRPETLRLFAQSYKDDVKIAPWHFITSWSKFLLAPTLKSFGQDISRDRDAVGGERIVINHLLKVFLIDRDGWVREIYTSAFLDQEVLLNDIKTLLIEERQLNMGN
jgi:cytochrome oxidase Cu insertion factor (SCO1/SenC/PrrC family)